jgi:hypothetical protein
MQTHTRLALRVVATGCAIAFANQGLDFKSGPEGARRANTALAFAYLSRAILPVSEALGRPANPPPTTALSVGFSPPRVPSDPYIRLSMDDLVRQGN